MSLPRWAVLLAETSEFDPDGDWCRIICTDRGKHVPELLGLVFEHPNRGRLWSGPHIHLTRANDAEQVVDMDDPLRVPQGPAGAVNLTCPACSRTPRCTREQWSQLTGGLPMPGIFDTSALP